MKAEGRGVLLLAHGTVERAAELPEFLARIRHGRPASPELVAEMGRRYAAIGGSPLLQNTRAQAAALAARLGMPCEVAMRLWRPEVADVVPTLVARGVRSLCLLPLAPFSVSVYVDAAERALQALDETARPVSLGSVEPWGDSPAFANLQAELVSRFLDPSIDEHVILTAHSLPQKVIQMGDRYATNFEQCANAIGRALSVPFTIAYQSQGADGGDWLGPDLLDVMTALADRGIRRLIVAPVGFVAEHVETLYDLDIEARAHAQKLGVEFVRVPTVGSNPAFIELLAQLVENAFRASDERRAGAE